MKVRRERKERADMAAAHAANLAVQASGGNAMAVDGDEEGGGKKKEKYVRRCAEKDVQRCRESGWRKVRVDECCQCARWRC
jgi:hypothetical protein